MSEEQLWELLNKLTKEVVDSKNCVLNILLGPDFMQIQLIPDDVWFEGCDYE